jgi:hypothetical protein
MSLVAGHPDFDDVTRFHQVLAQAKETVRSNRLHYVWDDMDGDPTSYGNSTRWNPAAGWTNSGSAIAGDAAGGAIIFSTGATGTSIAGLAPANAIGGAPLAKSWYMHAKAKIPTTPGANSVLGIGFTDGTNTAVLGVIGSLSTTAFVLQHSASLATTKSDLGVTVDTVDHTFEMWGNGSGDGVIFARMDSGVVVSVVPTVVYSKQRLLVTARNGGTAADQRLQLGHIFFAVQP